MNTDIEVSLEPTLHAENYRDIASKTGILYTMNSRMNDFEKGDLIRYYSFVASGLMSQRDSFRNDDFHGISFAYWPNGQMREVGYYQNGELHGIMKMWGPDGNLRRKKLYKNGALVKDYLS